MEKKTVKAETAKKTLLRYFRIVNNTTITENSDILKYHIPETKVHFISLSLVTIAFHSLNSLHTKRHAGSEKTYSSFNQKFYFPTCQITKPFSHQKQPAEKQDCNEQNLYFKLEKKIDAKGTISRSSEITSYIMVIFDAFTCYVALNPVPHFIAKYA